MPSKPKSHSGVADAAALAELLSEALLRERSIPRFVDSYVVEHGRHSLQVHAGMYRDLLNLLQREALLTVSARALELITRGIPADDRARPKPMTRNEGAAFRKKYLAGLTRHHRWNLGEALEFQSDLQMYEELIARAATRRPPRPRRPRIPRFPGRAILSQEIDRTLPPAVSRFTTSSPPAPPSRMPVP